MANCDKYLQTYAEPEITSLITFPNLETYKNTVVIPAYNETDIFIDRFINSKLSHQNVLLILVINQPNSEVNSQPQLNLAYSVNQSGQKIWQQNNLTLFRIKGVTTDILVVDRFSDNLTITDKQGVGLARKIGADIATALICKGVIDSPWICSTDADTHLPDDYFSVLSDIPVNTSAINYNFNHIKSANSLSEATLRYEQALRYYVAGLKWAGSSYAFHTIGSTLAFRYDYYAMVRGFPKRAAGEDFYLLNKLAKQATVLQIDDVTLTIEPRVSNRVPFGTGPAVAKILALDNIDDYHYYHPQVFVELKSCLSALNLLWREREDLEYWLSELSEPVQFALRQLQFNKLIDHLMKQVADEQQCNRQIRQWFDAFRTLKFIHYIQAMHFPSIPLKQGIAQAHFSCD